MSHARDAQSTLVESGQSVRHTLCRSYKARTTGRRTELKTADNVGMC